MKTGSQYQAIWAEYLYLFSVYERKELNPMLTIGLKYRH